MTEQNAKPDAELEAAWDLLEAAEENAKIEGDFRLCDRIRKRLEQPPPGRLLSPWEEADLAKMAGL